MVSYKLTRDAQNDIKAIQAYTRKTWGLVQAKKYLSELRNHFIQTFDMPSIGAIAADSEAYANNSKGFVDFGEVSVGLVEQ